MSSFKVIVMQGGDSSEREVSVRSGAAVAKALKSKGYKVSLMDPLYELDEKKLKEADAVFIALHGGAGENGALQAQLDAWDIAYIGSDQQASALCMDKWNYRQLMQPLVLMAPAELVDQHSIWQSLLSERPFVLKPRNAGSSIDVVLVQDPSRVDEAVIRDVFSRHPQMIIEEYIVGTELSVGVLGDQALTVAEIIPSDGKFFDYDSKYSGKTQELVPPQHVSAEIQQQAQELALKAHHATGCRDLSRSDLIATADGKVYLLETNTIPGLTAQSLYPRMAAEAKLSMPDLCDMLVQMAYNRKALNRTLAKQQG